MPGAAIMMGVGGVSVLDSQSLTIGNSGTLYGYASDLGMGGVSDGTSNLYSGAAIVRLTYDSSTGLVSLVIAGNGLANSGWETMRVVGTGDLLRTLAGYSTNGVNTFWTWAGSLPLVGTVEVQFLA